MRNLASVRTYGFEGDLAVRPFDGVRFTLGVGYADPKIGDDTFQVYSANPTAPVAGAVTCGPDRQLRAQAGQASDGAERQPAILQRRGAGRQPDAGHLQDPGQHRRGFLRPPAGESSWFARAEYRYESRQFLEVENYGWLPARNLVNLRAGVKTARFSVTAFVENLTDNRTAEAGSYQLNLSDFSATNLTSFLPARRLIGVTLGFDY